MRGVWEIQTLVGAGTLKLCMSRAEVDALTPLLGAIDGDVREETDSDGRQVLVEYRSLDAPACGFEGNRLTEINIGESDRYDFQFKGVSVFQDKPRSVFKAFAAERVYWMNGRLAFPKLSLQVDGCVEYIEDELIFPGGTEGFHISEGPHGRPRRLWREGLGLAMAGAGPLLISEGDMSEVWKIEPLVGVGPLKLGMSRAEVDALTPLLGPIDGDVQEETDSDGHQILVEYRSLDAPECVFDDGRLTKINIGESDRYDFQFNGISAFRDEPRNLYEALTNAAGQVYWWDGRLVFPKLSFFVTGCVNHICDGLLVFQSDQTGHMTRRIRMAGPGTWDDKIESWLEVGEYRY